jgi:hypothetical protein
VPSPSLVRLAEKAPLTEEILFLQIKLPSSRHHRSPALAGEKRH